MTFNNIDIDKLDNELYWAITAKLEKFFEEHEEFDYEEEHKESDECTEYYDQIALIPDSVICKEEWDMLVNIPDSCYYEMLPKLPGDRCSEHDRYAYNSKYVMYKGKLHVAVYTEYAIKN